MPKYLSLQYGCVVCNETRNLIPGEYIAATEENTLRTEFFCIPCATEEFGSDLVNAALHSVKV